MIRPTFSFRVVTKILLPRSPPMMAFRYLCHLIGSSFHTSSRTSRKRFPFSCSKRSSWIKFMFVVVVENSLVADSSVSFVSLVSSKFSETHTHIRNWKQFLASGRSPREGGQPRYRRLDCRGTPLYGFFASSAGPIIAGELLDPGY
ncbi:hypothetical protein BHE74_00026349 [Ensete ventricosum]|nr:hypothetical protein BHE74_00026349 [Ensete ventricosum]RZR90110.1 hypothetical protein BHM03_00017934 [Ensete ventricosum]